MLRLAALTVGTVIVGFAQGAWADATPRVRLSVRSEIESCVDEQVLRDAVAARLGYQPFSAEAPSSVTVTIGPSPTGFTGQVERFDAAGKSLGLRRFSSPTCAQLVPSIELALAIAIDPLSLARPPPAPPPPPLPTPAPPSPPSPPLGVTVEVGGLGALAIQPEVTGGVTVGAELRWPSFSLGLEGQDDFPTSTKVGTGPSTANGSSVQVSTLYASAVPCLRLRYFGACAVASGGAWQINGINLVNAAHNSAPFAALGARALGEYPLVGLLSVRLSADLLAPLARETISSGNTVLWTTPSLAAEVALLLAVRLR